MHRAPSLLFLEHLESFKWKFHLKGIERLFAAIGNPHHRLRFIHVAGSNGKGSTCAMLAQILQGAGYRVGLYTSPHLKRYNERIQVNGKPISDRKLAQLVAMLKRYHKRQTFFEFFTALAMQYFAEQKVDIVVLETGLGGRLDATNVVTPLLSVISPISLEHTDILGTSIEKIASEKGGIIKRNVPVVTNARGKALPVLKRIATRKDSPLVVVKRKYHGKIGLGGEFQQENAALAVAAAKELERRKLLHLSTKSIGSGIAKAKWPGRLDLRGNVLYDCAHNPAGIRALASELRRMRLPRPVVCVFGVLKDKDWKGMLAQLEQQADYFVLTNPSSKRGRKPHTLRAVKPFRIIDDPRAALRTARRIAGSGTVLVTGSMYLVGSLLPP